MSTFPPDVPENVNMEDYKFLSIEYLYHFIRFTAFPSVSTEQMRNLFLKAANVPLRDPEVFAVITEAVQKNDFALLENAFNGQSTAEQNKQARAKAHVFENQPAIIAAVGAVGGSIKAEDLSIRVWSTIVNSYFNESDSKNAFDLFRTLIFFPIYDGDLEPIQEFVTRYSTEKDTYMRNRMISGNIYNAVFI